MQRPGLLTLSSELKMPIMQLPIKMTLLNAGEANLLISPLPNLEPTLKQVNEFGKITDVIAPSLFHDLGIENAGHTFSSAKLWAAKGLRERKPHLNWYEELSSVRWTFGDYIDLIEIDGMPKTNECVFLHKSSKTLVVSDLCFNHLEGRGLGNWIIFNLFGTYRKFAVSRLFLSMVKDKVAFKRSLENLFSYDFDNIVVPHGVDVEGGAKQKLRSALERRGFLIGDQKR